MKFEIVLQGLCGAWIVNTRKTIGMKEVNRIREELGINLPLDRIIGEIETLETRRVSSEISEETARNSGHFSETSKIEIGIKKSHFLNRFLKLDLNAEKNEETGEIKQVSMKWRLDEKEIEEAWKKAGCPLEWKE